MKRSSGTGFRVGWVVVLGELVRRCLPLFWVGASAFLGFDVAQKFTVLKPGQWIGFIGIASLLVVGTLANPNDSLRTKITVAFVAILTASAAFLGTLAFVN